MLQELLTRLPSEAGPRGLAVALAVAAAGLVLWVAGARFSRSIFTLVGVAAGAWLGLRVPRWMGWEIDAMAISIGGALVLGLAGYLLHTMWVGAALGTMLAAAGVGIAWHRLGLGVGWSLPVVDTSAGMTELIRSLWKSLPDNPAPALPTVAGVCLAAGGLIAAVWPKLGRVLTFSLLGSLMLVGGGLAAMRFARPPWIESIPAAAQTQGVTLAILVVLGAAMQWALLPRAGNADEKAGSKNSDFLARTPRGPRDVRDLGASKLGPMKLKEARA